MSSENPSTHGTHATPYDDRHLAKVADALKLDRHPQQIGPYRIIETIGEGGMGTVYRAEQRTPIQRSVAIKVIKLGMDTQAVMARFESERNALAMMDHPNVARVLDAGTTMSGRPYFVMELVDGTPITAYADENRVNVPDRLRLLAQACDAVQHAHQKAIIHRDIKPSNILVAERDGVPVVKVIDFGVAKAVEKSTAEQALFTEVGQMIGTPEYMSPEQADGERDIDTRTDVYSLGVVLYELLSGALPFDSKTLRSAGYGEVLRIIRNVDPPRPSARLSGLGEESTTVAERRQSSPALLVQQLRSELDWIVVKSLSKDRESRYASVHESADDLHNYLGNRPLRAGPESIGYRARKFARRNRSAVLGAAAAVALLTIGVAATTWQAVRATRAERATREEQTRTLAEKGKAESAQQSAEAANVATAKVNEFLIEMLGSVNPMAAQGKEVLVRDVIDHAAADVGVKFKDQPKVEAEVRTTLGQTYSGLGLFAKADEHLSAACRLHRSLSGDAARDTQGAKLRVATLRFAEGKQDEAFTMINEVVEQTRLTFGTEDTLTTLAEHELANVCDLRGDYATAESLYRKALARHEQSGDADTVDYFITLGNLGQMMRPMGRVPEAEPLCQKAMEGMTRLKGPNDPVAIDMLGVYADVLRLQGKLPEAERAMRDYLDRAGKVYGPDHLRAIIAEQGLAVVLESSGKKDEALALFRSALSRVRRVMGPEHHETLMQMQALAASRLNNHDHEEAGRLFQEAYDGWAKSVGPEHPNALFCLYGLVQKCYRTQRWAEALEPAKTLYEQLQDPKQIQIPTFRRARYLSAYGIALAHLHRHEEAAGPLTFAYEALATQDLKRPGLAEAFRSVLSLLAKGEEARGNPQEAKRWRDRLEALDASTATTKPAAG